MSANGRTGKSYFLPFRSISRATNMRAASEDVSATSVFHIRRGLARRWSFVATCSDEHDSSLFRGLPINGNVKNHAERPPCAGSGRRNTSAFGPVDPSRRNYDCDCRDLYISPVLRQFYNPDHSGWHGHHGVDDRARDVVHRCPALRKKTPRRPATVEDVQSPKGTNVLLSCKYTLRPPPFS